MRVLLIAKVMFTIVCLAAVAISLVYTIFVGSDDPQSDQGRTAVCKDGAVLTPPWNLCGAEHGYLDHWQK